MAVEYCDSFNTYSASQINRRYPGVISADIGTPGPDGSTGQYIKANTASGPGTFPINVTPRSEYYIGFDLRSEATTISGVTLTIKTAAGATICVINNASGFTTTFGNSATGLMVNGTWYQVAIYIKRHASAGILTIKIDGVQVLNLTGLNTGSTDIGLFVMGLGANGSNPTSKFGNLWIFNTTGSHSNTWPSGRMKVRDLRPNADGTYFDWTPNSGSTHYNRVNEVPPDDDTTYNSAITVGKKDSFACTDLPTSGIVNVHGVQVTAIVRKDDVDSKKYQLFAVSGATETFSSDIDANLNYSSTSRDGVSALLLQDDPDTSAAWTVTGVNALEIGIKLTT